MGFTYWVRSCAAVLAFSALIGCGNDDRQVVSSNETVDWSKVKLVLGDQAKGLRTVVEASKAFDGVPYQVEWANFQGAAPLFEALRAGAVDLAPAGDTPVLAAATGGAPLRIVAVRRSQARSIPLPVSRRLQSWGIEALEPVEDRDVDALQQVDDLFVEKKIFPHAVKVAELVDRQAFEKSRDITLR